MQARNRYAVAVLMATSAFLLGPTPALAAGDEMPSLVQDIGVSLLLAGVLAVVFVRLKIPSIAAFLAAGVVAGPLVLAQVTDPANIDTIARLGFIFLLFTIGLELDVKKILAGGKPIILTGVLQFPLSILFIVIVIQLLGLLGLGGGIIGSHPYSALYIGVILAMSSTLLVVKLFQEHFELDTEPGRIALGILILQDIWAIIVILVQPNLANPQIVPILMSFVGIGVILVATVGLSRTLAAVGFKWIAKAPELTIVVAVSWCFIVIFLGLNLDLITASLFGFNLHMAVGSGMAALIAGATIANLPYSTEIVTKVGNVKDFFVTLFFIGLGMGVPTPESWDVPIFAFVLAALAILTRQVVFFPLLYVTGCDQRNSEVSSARLAQISEFGLVIAFLGVQHEHISPSLSSAIIFAFVLTALLTPTLYNNAYRIYEKISLLLSKIGFKPPPEREPANDESFELALLGFHRVASSLLYDLERSMPEILKKTLVVDFNINIHTKIAERGVTVKYGDLSNKETLHHAGIEHAKIILCTIPDDLLRGVTNAKLVQTVRHISPEATIIANAVQLKEVKAVYDAGADYVYLGRMEVSSGIMEIIGKCLTGNLSEFRAIQQAAVAHRREVFD
jgi:Kef-type K+ transport system membrane component KefB/Trk K+ transport system NAD-binding subunit